MKPVFLTLALAGALVFAGSAFAQNVCMPEMEMEAALIDWYGEEPKGQFSSDKEQLWASDENGTWTVVRSLADGNACVIAQGKDWMNGANDTELLARLTD